MKVNNPVKFCICLVSATLLLGLAACGSGESEGTTTKAASSSASNNDPSYQACMAFFPKTTVKQAGLKEDLDLAFMAATLSYEQNSTVDSSSLANIKKYHSEFKKAMKLGSENAALYSELNNVDAPFAYVVDNATVVSDQMDTSFWNSQYAMVEKTCKAAYKEN